MDFNNEEQENMGLQGYGEQLMQEQEEEPADAALDAAEEMAENGDGHKKSKPRRTGLAFIAGMICMALIITAVLYFGSDHVRIIGGKTLEYYRDLDTAYGKYYEIMQLIAQDPLVEEQPADLTEDDIRKLVASLDDPYAQYYTAEEYEEFYNSFAGDYVGVGIGIVNVDGQIVIKSVFSNGSAAEAGIKMNDIIIEVDGQKPESTDEAVSMITGEEGTSVTVKVLRDGEELSFTLDRVRLDQESVVYYELEDAENVGYINVLSFVKETDGDFKLAVKDLENSGCDRFIIDLRNNGGGLTDSSIKMADYLLPQCTIMTDVSKDGTETVYSSEASAADIEFVVLVNENTASASEIFTAAIQDNNGGKVIGTKTYGKGVTQSVHKFSDGSALKYTVSEYYRPNGDKVQGIGITPDIKADDENIMDTALEELK